MERFERRGGQGEAGLAALPAAQPAEEAPSAEWFMPFIPTDSPADTLPGGGHGGAGHRAARDVPWYIPIVGGALMLFAIVAFLTSAGAGVAGTAVTAAATENHVVSVVGRPAIVIENASGRVRVVTGPSDHVTVAARKEARALSHAGAVRDLDEMHVAVAGGGTAPITIDARSGEAWGLFAHRSIGLTITVPKDADITLTMKAGNVTIEGVAGKFDAEISAGNLELRDVTLADGSRVGVNAGNAHVSGTVAQGASLDLRVNAGNLTLELPASTRATLDARATAGTIRVADWPRPFTISTPGGGRGANQSVSGPLASNPTGTISVQVNAGSFVLLPQ